MSTEIAIPGTRNMTTNTVLGDAMAENAKFDPETTQALEALKNFELVDLVGDSPVEAHGWLDGLYWYFRATGPSWTFEVGGNPAFTAVPIWWHEESWGEDDTSAGYMTNQEAASCILKAIKLYKSAERQVPKPGDNQYADHVMRAWSAGLISAAKAGETLSMNVIEVVELGLAKGLAQPWTAAHEVERYAKLISTGANSQETR